MNEHLLAQFHEEFQPDYQQKVMEEAHLHNVMADLSELLRTNPKQTEQMLLRVIQQHAAEGISIVNVKEKK